MLKLQPWQIEFLRRLVERVNAGEPIEFHLPDARVHLTNEEARSLGATFTASPVFSQIQGVEPALVIVDEIGQQKK